MDLNSYTMEDLLAAAIKSEVEADKIYSDIADKVSNAFLKDRMKYLAGEEARHRAFLETLWRKKFPGVGIVLPEESKVPMPKIKIWDENMPISDVLTSAMEAEKTAAEFYRTLGEIFGDKETKDIMNYLATMEMGHYRILEEERTNTEIFEDYDTMWPLMHAGP